MLYSAYHSDAFLLDVWGSAEETWAGPSAAELRSLSDLEWWLAVFLHAAAVLRCDCSDWSSDFDVDRRMPSYFIKMNHLLANVPCYA